MNQFAKPSFEELTRQRAGRAAEIARFGSLTTAIESGGLPRRLGLTLSEALVLGLLKQGVRSFLWCSDMVPRRWVKCCVFTRERGW